VRRHEPPAPVPSEGRGLRASGPARVPGGLGNGHLERTVRPFRATAGAGGSRSLQARGARGRGPL